MARDVFSVKASSVASESASSLAGNLIGAKRNNLSDECFTALMQLKSWQRILNS